MISGSKGSEESLLVNLCGISTPRTRRALHRLEDNDITRYVFSLEGSQFLVSVNRYETIQSHFDSLRETLNRRIEGDAEPPKHDDDALPSDTKATL